MPPKKDPGHPQPENTGYPQPTDAGYPQPANTGSPQPPNAGYPQPANAGYPQSANASYPQPTILHTTQPGQNVLIVTPNSGEIYVGPLPISIICRSCNQQIVTRVERHPSVKTHLIAVIICLLFWPCVFVPYCTPHCLNAHHFCPNCNAYIGSHNF